MQIDDFRPVIVGRDDCIERLNVHLKMTANGLGSMVLISGEAGIGKTRLVEEVVKEARSKGFRILLGRCLCESLTPYMPFLEALRSGGLETLFAGESPRVEGVYLVTRTGLLIREVLREKTQLDPDLFASMLSTVADFVRDSLSQLRGDEIGDSLNRLGFGEYTILVESGRDVSLAVILRGRENEFLIDDMRRILHSVHKSYSNLLKDWNGDEEETHGIEDLMRPLVSSGKYDGIYYGRSDPESRRNLLFENVTLGLARQTEISPVLLCLEDLHWADSSTLALMHYVARNTRKCRILILGTFRSEEITAEEGRIHPLAKAIHLMAQEELFESIELNRLSEGETSRLMESILGGPRMSENVSAEIYAESEGNPLYIVELVKMFIEEDLLQANEGGWTLSRSIDSVGIPSKVCEVILWRLNRVKKDDRRILDYASVIGDSFTSELLSQAIGMDRLNLLERLRVLEKTHRLIHPSEGGYAFDHALIREVLYNDIPLELRREYHSIIARSIEFLNSENLESVAGDLAFHYYKCEDKKRASRYLLWAAEMAKEDYSNEEAIKLYTQALEVEDESAKRREIMEDLGAVYELTGNLEEALNTFEQALQIAENPRTKSRLLSFIAGILESRGDYDSAIRRYEDALSLVKDERNKEEADALAGLGIVYWQRGEYEKALEHYEKSFEIMKEIEDEAGISSVLNNIGNLYLQKGDLDKATENYLESMKLRERLGDQRGLAHAFSNTGAAFLRHDELDKAYEHFQQALLILERMGDQRGVAYCLNNLGVIHEDRGEYEEALEYYMKSMEMAKKTGDQQMIASTIHNVGLIHKHRKEYDRALDSFQESIGICERIGFQLGLIFNSCCMAEVHLVKGNLKHALELCNHALEISKDVGAKEYLSKCKRTLGMIYRKMRRWDEATNNLKEAISMCRDLGREKELGISYLEYGRTAVEKGDLDEGRASIKKSISVFAKLGLARELEEAERILGNLA